MIVDISAGLLNTVWKTVLDFTGGRTRRRFSMSYRFSPRRFGLVGIAAPRTLSTVMCRKTPGERLPPGGAAPARTPLTDATAAAGAHGAAARGRADSKRGRRSLEDAGARTSLAGHPQ